MKKRKVSAVKFLLAPLVILIVVLGYYQFLYKSKQMKRILTAFLLLLTVCYAQAQKKVFKEST